MNSKDMSELKSFLDAKAMQNGIMNHNIDMDMFKAQVKDELMNRIQKIAAERMQTGAIR